MGEPISTHAPLQGATTVAFMLRRPPYFNSRTRVWCDRIRSAQGNRSFQLTHPVRGATIVSDVQPCNIFQLPHPVWGTTAWSSSHLLPTFQLTHPRGVRRYLALLGNRALRFQFPPPVRGATSSICCRDGNNRISTPAPAWGATIVKHSGNKAAKQFQLPHPHGVRPGGLLLVVARSIF